VDLKVNYRSTSTIVNNANHFVEKSGMKNIIGVPSTTPNGNGQPIKYLTNCDMNSEADRVFELVQYLEKEKGIAKKDMAILYRVHSQAMPLEDLMIMNDYPYIMYVKNSFYMRKEVRDILEYLSLFLDPENLDKKSLKRLINKPVRYVSNKALEEFEWAVSDYDGHWEALQEIWDIPDLNPKQREYLRCFYNNIATGHNMHEAGAKPEKLIDYVLNTIGYEDWLLKEKTEKDPDNDSMMNFDTIKNTARLFDKTSEFLEYIEEVKEKSKEKKDENGDYLKMMSIHASKGKEFKAVIIIGGCSRIYPFYRSVQEGNEEEEKRVMYVAITRPIDELYISTIDGMYGRFNVQPTHYLNFMDINYLRGETNAYI
jgi:DNA helicase-2/ATP-dependent DNA helicase PcrA